MDVHNTQEESQHSQKYSLLESLLKEASFAGVTSAQVPELLQNIQEWRYQTAEMIEVSKGNCSAVELQVETAALTRTLLSLSEQIDEVCALDRSVQLTLMGDLAALLVYEKRFDFELEGQIKLELEEILEALALSTDMPPRDTLESYVRLNAKQNTGRAPITYSGGREEANFIELTEAALVCLDQVVEGWSALNLEDLSAAEEIMKEMVGQMDRYREVMLSFNWQDPTAEKGQPMVSASFFYNVMRDYFPELEIGGKGFAPPSAAYSYAMMIIDIQLGAKQADRNERIAKRAPYYLPEEREQVYAAVQKEEASELFLDKLLVGLQSGGGSPHQAQLQRLGAHFLELVKLNGLAAHAHWGLVRGHLQKPNQQEQKQAKAHLVDPTQGVSGMSFADVEQIRDSRDIRKSRSDNQKIELLKSLVGAV